MKVPSAIGWLSLALFPSGRLTSLYFLHQPLLSTLLMTLLGGHRPSLSYWIHKSLLGVLPFSPQPLQLCLLLPCGCFLSFCEPLLAVIPQEWYLFFHSLTILSPAANIAFSWSSSPLPPLSFSICFVWRFRRLKAANSSLGLPISPLLLLSFSRYFLLVPASSCKHPHPRSFFVFHLSSTTTAVAKSYRSPHSAEKWCPMLTSPVRYQYLPAWRL